MDTFQIEAGLLGLEKYFGCSEALAAYQDLATIRKFVIFLEGMTLLSVLLGSLIIVDDEAHFLFDVFYDFDFGVCGEAIASVV